MKESLLTAVIVTLLFNPVFSQSYKGQGRIKGIVTDAEGNPLEGVKIRLFSLRADSGFETESDKKGEWKANWIRSGMWYIDFTKLEYEPRKISISIIELGKNPLLEITMKKIEGVAIAEDIMKDFQKANKFYDEEEYEEAIAAYKRILTDHPDAFIINQNVGNAYFALKDYDRAIEFYKKVVERQWYSKVNVGDIEDAIAVYNIGVLFFNSGNYEKAVTYLMRAVEIDKELSDAYYQLGMSYLAAGKNQEAREVLEKFLELNPESDKAGIAKSIIETLSKKKR
jgi:tetratricopeptide (TPR) repeat protein